MRPGMQAGAERKPTKRLEYHVCIKGPAIKSCYGCKHSFAECYTRPPKDVIIRRFINRRYIDKNTGLLVQSPKISAAYFHLNMNCLRKDTPSVNTKDIYVHDEVWPLLTEERLARLRTFGLNLAPDVEYTGL